MAFMATPLPLDRSVMGLLRQLSEVVFWLGVAACVFFLFLAWWQGWMLLGVVGFTGIFLALYAGFIEPYWFQVVTHNLTLKDEVKRSVRIIFLSDFHTGEAKTKVFYDALFARVQALRPDLVLLGGDYIECLGATIRDLAGIGLLTPKYGVYFVLGNHDYWDDPELVRDMLKSFGAKDLTGKTYAIGEEAKTFTLTGVDDAWLGTPRRQLPLAKSEFPIVLLTHESDILLDLPDEEVDLVFLGHTHGGQVRLPGYGSLTKLPQSTPDWLDRGLKTWRGMRLLISQGIGESSARVRLFARPQIIVVDI
jgi:predicted MPP superfamily phosphohydrolase